jgi:hypothetical protein
VAGLPAVHARLDVHNLRHMTYEEEMRSGTSLALAPERDRVRDHTAGHVNARIDREMAERLRAADTAGPEALRRMIARIDREWDVDRALMANFAILGGLVFLGSATAARKRRGRWTPWHTLLSVQLTFLLAHAIAGWCPPLPVFRRLGFRTSKEIERERAELAAKLAATEGAAAARH